MTKTTMAVTAAAACLALGAAYAQDATMTGRRGVGPRAPGAPAGAVLQTPVVTTAPVSARQIEADAKAAYEAEMEARRLEKAAAEEAAAKKRAEKEAACDEQAKRSADACRSSGVWGSASTCGGVYDKEKLLCMMNPAS